MSVSLVPQYSRLRHRHYYPDLSCLFLSEEGQLDADPESESSSSSTAEEIRREGDVEIEEREAEGGSCRIDGGRSRIGSASTREVREGKSPIHQLGGD
jgi:hypothetical protein